jgi:hypothetical protein
MASRLQGGSKYGYIFHTNEVRTLANCVLQIVGCKTNMQLVTSDRLESREERI